MRISKRDSTRVSRTNRPWAPPGMTSPTRSLMVNVDSSTRVMVPAPESTEATLPAYVQGLATAEESTRATTTSGIDAPFSKSDQ